ncbi:MAG: DUF3667 domain-containing protein [Hyphomonadaceae bacterium]|nr:DUF3667 domain-containing protein [Hyphomonadaceae bacterium]
MTGEFEAAGALATAGVVGAAIEGREGGGADGAQNCANCDAPVSGRYCSNCGQHAQPHRKLSSLAGEFLNGLWHLDTKTWRTVPMVLFRPGTLTRNYVYGKRARYLSPLTMFLFAIFLMFFAFSTIEAPMNVRDNDVEVTQSELNDAREELAQARADLEQARAHPDPDSPEGLEVSLAEGAVSLAQAQVDRLEGQLAETRARAERAAREEAGDAATGTDPAAPAGTDPAPAPTTEAPATTTANETSAEAASDAAPDGRETRYETWQDGAREIAASDDFVVFGGADQELNERVRRKFENPDLALYQIQDAASKYSFLLAPLSLPFIALLFLWKRGVTLYDHMAYALYALAFAALLFSGVVLLGKIPIVGWAAGWLLLLLPVHMYFHLGGAYALGRWSALWRTVFMLNFALIVACTFLVLVVVAGLAG